MTHEQNHAREQAAAQLASIRDMVAALSVDYERLEELQNARDEQKSIISGTMRPADLVPAFLAELAERDRETADEYFNQLGEGPFNDADHGYWATDEASDLVGAVADALNDAAPCGLFFGSHPGDGSDYGYWLDEETADELDELEAAADGCSDQDDAHQRIRDDALSVEVRSDWHTPGDDSDPSEFQILLCTGGPAVRIRGELDHYGEPCRAWLEYQDWFKPWTERINQDGDQDTLLAYSCCFYFGQ